MNVPSLTEDRDTVAAHIGGLLQELRARKPLVQNITNFVAMDISANALLAVGAAPAMVRAPEESVEFARIIDALVLNTGTLTRDAADAMVTAARAAREQRKPWLIDPVGVGGLSLRSETVLKLLEHGPSLVRGNGSEIIAMARLLGLSEDATVPRGVESVSAAGAAETAAIELARHCKCTVAATGQVDFITDGTRVLRLANGHEIMTRVTALGCSLSSVAGAFLGIAEDPFEAAAGALAIYGVAGDMAFESAQRPASFRTAFLDMLDAITAGDIQQRLKVIP